MWGDRRRSLFLVAVLIGIAVCVVSVQAACDKGCDCLLPAKAAELGYSVFCGGKQAVCGYDAAKNAKYCYQIPVACPSTCACYTLEDGKEKGYPYCGDTLILCGYRKEDQRSMFCHQLPKTEEPVTCPSTCTCQETKKYLEAGYTYCGGKQTNCGEDPTGHPLSCFEKPVTEKPVSEKPVPCAKGCSCLNATKARVSGYQYCGGTQTLCGYDTSKNPLYCFEKEVTPAPVPVTCPSSCACSTLEEGTRQGLSLYEGTQTLCGYGPQQTPLYCFLTPTVTVTPTEEVSLSQAHRERVSDIDHVREVVIEPREVREWECILSGSITNFHYDPETLKVQVTEVRLVGRDPQSTLTHQGSPPIEVVGESYLVPVTFESGEFPVYSYSTYVNCSGTYDVRPVYYRTSDSCEWQGTWSPPSRTVEMEGADSAGNTFAFTPRSLQEPIFLFSADPAEPHIDDPVTVTIRVHSAEDVGVVRTKIVYTLPDGSTEETGPWNIRVHDDDEGKYVTVQIPEGKDATRAVIIAEACDAAGNVGWGSSTVPFGSCTDGIRNGGEVGVDCEGPCHDCADVVIRGRILYEEMNIYGNQSHGYKPARRIKFRFRHHDDNVGSMRLTGETGEFSVVLPRDGYAGEPMYLQIGGCSDYDEGLNAAAAVIVDQDGWGLEPNHENCYQYALWRTGEFLIPEAGDLDLGDLRIGATTDQQFFGFVEHRGNALDACGDNDPWEIFCDKREVSTPGGSVYFSIADTILTGREYADSHRDDDDAIGREVVVFPQGGISHHETDHHRIFLNDMKGFNDGTLIHEYGHHLMLKISTQPGTAGGEHGWCTSKDEGFAWSEGFPDYLATIIPYHNPYDPASPSNHYLEGPYISYSRIESPYDVCVQLDETYELANAAALWDFIDDPATFTDSDPAEAGFDNLVDHEDLVFALFDTDLDETFSGLDRRASPHLCDLIDAWKAQSGAPAADIDDIINEYGVVC